MAISGPNLLSAAIAEVEAALETFEWAYPTGGEVRGEVSLEGGTLVLSVWSLDNEDPDADELVPLRVTTKVRPGVDARSQIRELIHFYLIHEADEQLWFTGTRPFYPEHRRVASGTFVVET